MLEVRIVGEGNVDTDPEQATYHYGEAVTMAALLLQAYRRRLRAIVASAPTWVSEEILSASQGIDDDRPVLWRSDN